MAQSIRGSMMFLVFGWKIPEWEESIPLPWDAFQGEFESETDALAHATKLFMDGDIEEFQVVDFSKKEIIATEENLPQDTRFEAHFPSKFNSLWQMWAVGAIGLDEYNSLKDIPWEEIDALTRHDGWRAEIRKLIQRP